MSDQVQKVYPSMKAAANAEGIEIRVLKLAKTEGAPGFHPSGRINWLELGPWLADNADELVSVPQDTKEFWDIEIAKWKAKRARLLYEAEAKMFYGRNEVISTLQQISNAQKSMLISKCRNELQPRLRGKGDIEQLEILDRFALEICKVMQGGILKYSQAATV